MTSWPSVMTTNLSCLPAPISDGVEPDPSPSRTADVSLPAL